MTLWFFSQLHPLRPGFWLLLSLLTSLLLFVAETRVDGERRKLLHVLHRILIPYLGLLAGALSPRLMGLSDIDWVAGLGLGVAVIAGLWLLLILVRITLHRDRVSAPAGREPSLDERVLYAGAQEFHWVFLRGATWEFLLALPSPVQTPGYWAIWIASLLALPDLTLRRESSPQYLISFATLIMTAILFFYTRNFWLCWALHASVQLILGQLPGRRVPSEQSRGAS